jgi:type IV secretory pathway protease TraF
MPLSYYLPNQDRSSFDSNRLFGIINANIIISKI